MFFVSFAVLILVNIKLFVSDTFNKPVWLIFEKCLIVVKPIIEKNIYLKRLWIINNN